MRWKQKPKGHHGVCVPRREVKRRKRDARRLALRLFREATASQDVRTPARMADSMMHAVTIASWLRLRGLRSPARIARMAAEIAIEAGVVAYDTLAVESGPRWAAESRSEHDNFASDLGERWGYAIETCEVVRLIALEAGIEYHDEQDGDLGVLHEVLARLHARACLIADEIITLMRAGFASGAHARWRALHEVTVIATFIEAGGDELARRFLDYEHVESLAGMREYQHNAESLGREAYPAAEIREMEETVSGLCVAYGPLFRKRYGWAAEHFGYAPDYRTIEATTYLAHYRSYYRMASHPIHAGPKGIAFDLGHFGPEGMMLAGPSNAGFVDPGYGMCLSLTQITDVYLNLQPSASTLVSRRVLLRLTDRAGEALITAHRKLEEDEAESSGEDEAGRSGFAVDG